VILPSRLLWKPRGVKVNRAAKARRRRVEIAHRTPVVNGEWQRKRLRKRSAAGSRSRASPGFRVRGVEEDDAWRPEQQKRFSIRGPPRSPR